MSYNYDLLVVVAERTISQGIMMGIETIPCGMKETDCLNHGCMLLCFSRINSLEKIQMHDRSPWKIDQPKFI